MVPKTGGNRGRVQKRKPRWTGEQRQQRRTERGETEDFVQAKTPKYAEEEKQPDDHAEISDDDDDDDELTATSNAYSSLLRSLQARTNDKIPERSSKRRKLNGLSTRSDGGPRSDAFNHEAADLVANGQLSDAPKDPDVEGPTQSDGAESTDEADEDGDHLDSDSDAANDLDPYDSHFSRGSEDALSELKACQDSKWKPRTSTGQGWKTTIYSAGTTDQEARVRSALMLTELPLKQRLKESISSITVPSDPEVPTIIGTTFHYQDMMYGGRSPSNASFLREMTSLHTLNHILKGRDRVLRNNERLAKVDNSPPDDMDVRDQGFTRPKVLILLETREQCYKWVEALLKIYSPEQRENWSRFKDAFHADDHIPGHMPEDYRDLFEGNSDNDFRLGMKFTRKTVKLFSAFYTSDILLCSPLGLRRIIASSDPKKRDHDFLSSIEISVLDQASAMQQQNWSHVTFAMSHLNLPPKSLHDADLTRIKPFHLDNLASSLRQTLIFTQHVTPELTALFNTLRNVAGRIKLTPLYPGAITTLPLPCRIKQVFQRFAAPTPAADPDARFAHFAATALPAILKTCATSSAGSPAGILVFIPSYLDFVRLRNFFAASAQTEAVGFGAVSEYTSVSQGRRARSHFVTGRNQVLLYCGRAHHFHRYRVGGVKRVVWYGVPEAEGFYGEVLGWVGRGVVEGKSREEEVWSRAVFSRWDALALERVVGSERVGAMIREDGGDTFEFL